MTPIPCKRISVRDVMEKQLPVPAGHEQLFVVYGVVTASTPKKSKFEKPGVPNMLLMGRFKAVRASDRQEFTSERLYLPDTDYQNTIAKANEADANGEKHEISIAYNIGYKPATGSPTGYTFTCTPVIDYKVQDALADVEKQINFDKILPALAAPEKVDRAAKVK